MKIGIIAETVEDIILIDSEQAVSRLGSGTFTASISSLFGNETFLLTWVGKDLYNLMESTLIENSVKYQAFFSSSRTTKYIMNNGLGIDRRNTKVFIPDDKKISLNEIPNQLQNCDALLVYPMPKNILKKIVTIYKGTALSFDPQSTYEDLSEIQEFLPYFDYLFLNKQELHSLCGYHNLDDCLKRLNLYFNGYLIVKNGLGGSTVYKESEQVEHVPAYLANTICTIGAGDFYNVIFLSEQIRGVDLKNSMLLASYGASKLTEHIFLPDFSIIHRNQLTNELMVGERPPIVDNTIRIYLAAPFFNNAELHWVQHVCSHLENEDFAVFSPSRDAGIIDEYTTLITRKEIFKKDVSEIDKCDIVIALIDHDDQGTSWEIGYAHAIGKEVYCLQTSKHKPQNNMIVHSASVFSDLAQLISVLKREYV